MNKKALLDNLKQVGKDFGTIALEAGERIMQERLRRKGEMLKQRAEVELATSQCDDVFNQLRETWGALSSLEDAKKHPLTKEAFDAARAEAHAKRPPVLVEQDKEEA